MFIVGDNILETLLCNKCKKYLTVKPIKVYPNRGIQCGRCSLTSDAGVVSLFGVLAKEALFRCVNRFDGCNQLLSYSEVAEHEKLCEAPVYSCPVCTKPFMSNSFGIFVHYKEVHLELLLQNTEEFVLELEIDFQTTYLFRKNDLLFFVKVKYDINEEQLTLNTLCLANEKDFSKISQDFTLTSLDRQVKYCSIKDKAVSGTRNTLDQIKIDLKTEDIFKKMVICKLILNTEKVEKLLALPKGEVTLANQKIKEAFLTGSKLDKPIPKTKEPFKFGGRKLDVQNKTAGQGFSFSLDNTQANYGTSKYSGSTQASTSILSNGAQNARPATTRANVDINTLIKAYETEMLCAEKGGQWLMFKGQPKCIGEVQSFEEIRFGFYVAQKNGTMEQYKQRLLMPVQNAIDPTPSSTNILQIYNTPVAYSSQRQNTKNFFLGFKTSQATNNASTGSSAPPNLNIFASSGFMERPLLVPNKSRNEVFVDQLVAAKFIKNPLIEKAFRAVDRGHFASPEAQDDIYQNKPWRSGNLHQSAPKIYAVALEALNLKRGDRFLNVGSGTGYLSTIAGVLLGSESLFPDDMPDNVGVEICPDVVMHAVAKFEKWNAEKNSCFSLFKLPNIVRPTFLVGDCLDMNSNGILKKLNKTFDKIYCGAACPETSQWIIKQYLNVGGILVIPIGSKLLKMERLTETEWKTSTLLNVSFQPLITEATVKDEVVAKSEEPLQVQADKSTTITKQLTDNNSIEIKTQTDNTTDITDKTNVVAFRQQYDDTRKWTPTVQKPLAESCAMVTPIKSEKPDPLVDVGIKNEVAKPLSQHQSEALAKPVVKKSTPLNNLLDTLIKPLVDDRKDITDKTNVVAFRQQYDDTRKWTPTVQKPLAESCAMVTPIKSEKPDPFVDVGIKNEVAKPLSQHQADALAKPVDKKLAPLNNLLDILSKRKPLVDDRKDITDKTNVVAFRQQYDDTRKWTPTVQKPLAESCAMVTPIKSEKPDPFVDVGIKNEVAKPLSQHQADALAKPVDKKLAPLNNLLDILSKRKPLVDDRKVKCEPQRSPKPPSISDGFTCPECGRVISSQIGMWSHRHHTHGLRSPQIKDCVSPSTSSNFISRTPTPIFESYGFSPSISTISTRSTRSSGGGGGGGGGSCPECGRYISSSIGMWSHSHHTHGAI